MQKRDIVDFVQEYGLEVTKEGQILRAFCPFHQDTGRPNFTLYPETNSWWCFACSIGGDDVDFLSKIEGISKKEALQRLRGDGLAFDDIQEKVDSLYIPTELPTLNTQCDLLFSRLCRNALIENPNKVSEVFAFLRLLDKELESSIDQTKFSELANIFKQTVRNVV